MEQLIISFLKETSQWDKIKKSFIEYTKNVDEKESQAISSSIVLSFKCNYLNLVNVSRMLYLHND